jgi:AraC-like DNA-binding protein
MANVSVRTLQEAFRRHMGVSPTVYLRQIRLARPRRWDTSRVNGLTRASLDSSASCRRQAWVSR